MYMRTAMAGEFARAINAKNLIMTHFGGQFTNAFEYINSVMVPQAVKFVKTNIVFPHISVIGHLDRIP